MSEAEKVIHKDKNQPEFKLTFTKYKKRYLNDWTIDQAKKSKMQTAQNDSK